MSGPFEWRLNDVERDAKQGAEAYRRIHEIDSLRSDVDGLERANGELRSEVAWLRPQLEALSQRIEALETEQKP